MLGFRKVFNFKIISLIISISFLSTTTLYSYPISKDSLRVPVSSDTYERLLEHLTKNSSDGLKKEDVSLPTTTELKVTKSKTNNRIKIFFRNAAILTSAFLGLFWYFTRDTSFKDWPCGYPEANKIAFFRPVGTKTLEEGFNKFESDVRNLIYIKEPEFGSVSIVIPEYIYGVARARKDNEFEEEFLGRLYRKGVLLATNFTPPFSDIDREQIISVVNKYRPRYSDHESVSPLPELNKQPIEFDANKVHWRRVRHYYGLTNEGAFQDELKAIKRIKEIDPNSADDLEFQWSLADLQLMGFNFYTDFIFTITQKETMRRYDFDEDKKVSVLKEDIEQDLVTSVVKEYLELIRLIEGRTYRFSMPGGFYNNWSPEVSRLEETYRYRLLKVIELDLQRLIKHLTPNSYWQNDSLLSELRILRSYFRSQISEFGETPDFRSDIDDLIYSARNFKANYDEGSFASAVKYFESLHKGPLRQVAIENILAVEEARKILLPLKNYILQSSRTHDLPPDYLGMIILYQQLIKSGTPSYDLKVGLGHAIWHLGLAKGVDPYDVLFEAKTGNKFLDTVTGLIPSIKIRDEAGRFSAVLIGASPGVGLMEIRPAPPRENYSLEKSYPRNFHNEDFSIRGLAPDMALEVDTLMSTRELGLKLMFDSEFNIEAGAARLRRSINLIIAAQKSGQKATMPLLPDYSFITYGNGIYRDYDNVAVKLFGPDVIPWATISPFVNTPGISQILLNYKDIDLPCDLPLFSLICRQSGVFGQDIPGIIVGVNSLDKLELLIDFIQTTEDRYLKNAAIHTLTQLTKDPDKEISNCSSEYLRDIGQKYSARLTSPVVVPVTISSPITEEPDLSIHTPVETQKLLPPKSERLRLNNSL